MANEFKIKKGLIVNGSGSIVLDIQGSQGQLFSVTDQLTGTLFSVSDISGIPILEVDSDDTIRMGTFGSEAIIVSGSHATISGSFSGSFQGDGQSQWDDVTGGINYASGNVGIGTTNPESELTVNGYIQVPNGRGITFSDIGDGNVNRVSIVGSEDNDTMLFRADNSVKMALANGNVGIGTTNPSATFVVQPSETTFNLAGLANGQIALGNNTSSGKAPTIGSRTTSTGQPPLQFITGQPDTSTVPGMIFSVREDNNSDFGTTANKPAYDFTRFTTSLLRITRDGKVGIGTTSPSQKLQVQGGGVQFITTDDNQRLFITSSPSFQSIIYFGDTSSSTQGRVAYENSSDSMYFNTASSEKMRILANGNVGIGTTSPSFKLEVAGTINQTVLEGAPSDNLNNII